jgi:hypothetical protein
MSKWILTAGAAAIALSVPALAGPGGHGGGNGGPKAEHGGGQKAEHGGGGQKAERGDHGAKADHGARQQVNFNRGGWKAERQAVHVDRGHGNLKHAERQHARSEGKHNDQARDVRHSERFDVRGSKDVRVERRDFKDRDDSRRFADNDRGAFRGFADDCPPGLAKKGNGCLPPGQAKKLIGAALPAALASRNLDGPYSQWYRDDDRYFYRNDGDYIYRVNRDGGLIDSLFPYQDRDYSYYPVGMTYPSEYNAYNVPYQYQSFYPDNNDYLYRYGDGAIYQLDRSTNGIDSIVALLAGDLGVGQPLPGDYGVYNVPMAYRDRYYDTPDALYRYNDGYIYQADPKTQLITAVIDALV